MYYEYLTNTNNTFDIFPWSQFEVFDLNTEHTQKPIISFFTVIEIETDGTRC